MAILSENRDTKILANLNLAVLVMANRETSCVNVIPKLVYVYV